MLSVYLAAIVRLSMYIRVADATHVRGVHLCRGAQPVPYLPCLYIHRYILGGSRLREASEAQPFSYRFVSLRSFSLPRSSVARAGPSRARGIKYNKDIQWELIGYLPIYRSLSAYCCVVPLVQRQCTEPLPCRSVRTRLVSSSILRSSASLFFFHRAQIKIFRGGIISRITHVFLAGVIPRYRCVASASSRRTSLFFSTERTVSA